VRKKKKWEGPIEFLSGDAFPDIALIGSGFYSYLKGNPWPMVLCRQNR
jgi:hypothetical protein